MALTTMHTAIKKGEAITLEGVALIRLKDKSGTTAHLEITTDRSVRIIRNEKTVDEIKAQPVYGDNPIAGREVQLK